jgi:hypothetical protein
LLLLPLSLYICRLAHREWKWVWEYLWFQEKTCWKKILLLFQRFHNNLLPNFLDLFGRACVCFLGVCHQGIIEVRSWSLLIWHDLSYAVVFHVSRAGLVVFFFRVHCWIFWRGQLLVKLASSLTSFRWRKWTRILRECLKSVGESRMHNSCNWRPSCPADCLSEIEIIIAVASK